METVKVRNLEIGTGKPKICVPVTGRREEEILEAASKIRAAGADMIEWRADWYEHVEAPEKLGHMLKELRREIAGLPLLFTFRTAEEGGEKSLPKETYLELNRAAVKSGWADLLDVEYFTAGREAAGLIACARERNVKVIVSSHDFSRTPDKKEMVSRLCQMQEMGADLVKLAVMPREKRDVLCLLEATEEMVREHARCPVVTMSMSEIGRVSRVLGEWSGSAVTFGALGSASAPGQIELEELKELLSRLHGLG